MVMNDTNEEVKAFVFEVVGRRLTPEFVRALTSPANREMFEFEIGRACKKIISHGFKVEEHTL